MCPFIPPNFLIRVELSSHLFQLDKTLFCLEFKLGSPLCLDGGVPCNILAFGVGGWSLIPAQGQTASLLQQD